MENAISSDIDFSEELVNDINNAPIKVQKKFFNIVRMIQESGVLPRSLKTHYSYISRLYIGYVTYSNSHWRLLFDIDELESPNKLYFIRLVTHDDMDKYLKNIL